MSLSAKLVIIIVVIYQVSHPSPNDTLVTSDSDPPMGLGYPDTEGPRLDPRGPLFCDEVATLAGGELLTIASCLSDHQQQVNLVSDWSIAIDLCLTELKVP